MTFQFWWNLLSVTFQFWWYFSFSVGEISVLVKFQFSDLFVLVTFQFSDIFGFDDIIVLVIFQFWWCFSFSDISVLVTFKFWWHFIHPWSKNLLTWTSLVRAFERLTNQQHPNYRASPDFCVGLVGIWKSGYWQLKLLSIDETLSLMLPLPSEMTREQYTLYNVYCTLYSMNC